jgi:hypothetical protein
VGSCERRTCHLRGTPIEEKRIDGPVTPGRYREPYRRDSAHARRLWRKVSEYFEAAENQQIGWPSALEAIVDACIAFASEASIFDTLDEGASGEGQRRGEAIHGEDSKTSPQVADARDT